MHLLFEVEHTFDGKVGGVIDTASVEVAVGSTYADTLDGVDVVVLHQFGDAAHDVFDVVLELCVGVGGDVGAGDDFAVLTDKSHVGVGATDVDSDCVGHAN